MKLPRLPSAPRWFELDNYIRDYGEACARAALEEAAALCDDAATKLLTGGKRIHSVDRHTADVLWAKADAIRAIEVQQ